MQRLKSWKIFFAVLAVAGFALVTGHEIVHVEHSSHCKVCHVKQVTPSDVAATAGTAVFVAVVLALVSTSCLRPVSSARFQYAGRSPPVLA